MTLAAISGAGALGCVVRYLMEYALRRHHPTLRPWATAAANTLGCLVAGWGAYRLVAAADLTWRDVVLTGFCGGLTTFSSALAIPALLQREHHWGYALSLVVATPVLCGAGFTLGMALAH
jgi:CrcB protein